MAAECLLIRTLCSFPQVGTLNYMSPEAIQGGVSNPMGGAPLKVGRPSDVWSLGCILYQVSAAKEGCVREPWGGHMGRCAATGPLEALP